jgi:hypothetical protein
MDVEKEFSSMKLLVRDVLRESERARNDDAYLVMKVLERRSLIIVKKNEAFPLGVILLPFEHIAEFGAFETVRRVRQEIQNVDKEFLPTDYDVCVKRRLRSEAVRLFYAKKMEV